MVFGYPVNPDGKTKTIVNPDGSKVTLSAKRPTFEAAPTQALQLRLNAMGKRSSSRSRTLFAMLQDMRDFDPYISKAVENIITLGNPGYKLEVFQVLPSSASKNTKTKSGGKFSASTTAQEDNDDPTPDPEGLRLVQQFATRIYSEYNGAHDFTSFSGKDSDFPGVDFMIAMTLLNLFTFGAAASEVELTDDLLDIKDVYPVDPGLIDFWVNPEDNRLVPGILISGPFVPLDPVRFRYVGKDSSTNYPAGRSPLLAVLDTVFFLQQFYKDLQAIIHMYNTPRLDVKMIGEAVSNTIDSLYPQLNLPGQEIAKQEFIDGYITNIQTTIENLNPDDAFVHYDMVEAQFINPGQVAFPIDKIFAALNQQYTAATKQLPILLGFNEGATTTHATVQWMVFIENLKSYQRLAKILVIWALNLYLRVKGRNSYAVLTFNDHKTSDEYLDAQTFNLNTITYMTAVDSGLIDLDEAANELFGHDATGEVKPAAPAIAPGTDPGNPDASQVPQLPFKPTAEPKPTPNNAAQVSGNRAALPSDSLPDESGAVEQLPEWIKTRRAAMQKEYAHWRTGTITPTYEAAKAEALKQSEDMSDSEKTIWLKKNLTLSGKDQIGLPFALLVGNKGTYIASIQDNLSTLKIHKPVAIQDNTLAKIRDNATKSAQQIISTYHDDLFSAIGDAVQQGYETLWAIVDSLMKWEALRNAWKQAQIAMTETMATIGRAITDFWGNNDQLDGEAWVLPRVAAVDDECQDFIDQGVFPSMQEALTLQNFPAHVNCPHFWALTGNNLVNTGDNSAVWAG